MWRDRISNMYAEIGKWNICVDYMIFEIENICVRYFVMGLSSFIRVYVLPSAYLAPNCTGFLHHFCPPICT